MAPAIGTTSGTRDTSTQRPANSSSALRCPAGASCIPLPPIATIGIPMRREGFAEPLEDVELGGGWLRAVERVAGVQDQVGAALGGEGGDLVEDAGGVGERVLAVLVACADWSR